MDTPEARRPLRWLRVAALAILVAGVLAFVAFAGRDGLSLESIRIHRDALTTFASERYWAALVLACGAYVLAVLFSMPVGWIIALTIGLLFGRWVGTVLVVVSATIGAALVFAGVRYLFAEIARKRLGALGERINRGFCRDAFFYMLFLRLVPLFPFVLINIAAALTSIPMRTFVLGTMLGIVPGAFVYANLGQALGALTSTDRLLSLPMLAALGLLGLLALTPIAFRRLGQAGRIDLGLDSAEKGTGSDGGQG